jgi:hypothetical protein
MYADGEAERETKAPQNALLARMSRFLAGVEGFEPTTCGFGDHRSNQLS